MGMSHSDTKLEAEMPYKVVLYVVERCGSDGGEMMLINADSDLINDSHVPSWLCVGWVVCVV